MLFPSLSDVQRTDPTRNSHPLYCYSRVVREVGHLLPGGGLGVRSFSIVRGTTRLVQCWGTQAQGGWKDSLPLFHSSSLTFQGCRRKPSEATTLFHHYKGHTSLIRPLQHLPRERTARGGTTSKEQETYFPTHLLSLSH